MRDYKCRLRKKYYNEKASTEENISKFPPGVDRGHWISLVEYFAGAGKRLHQLGKNSRSLQTLLHHTGRKSHARVYDEFLEKNKREPTPLEKFEEVHKVKSKTGSPSRLSEPASVIVEAVKSRVAEITQDPNESARDLSDLQQEAFIHTIGPERPGRVRGYGFGVTQSMVYGSGRTSHVANLEVTVKSLKDENLHLKQHITSLEEKFAWLEQIVRQSQGSNLTSQVNQTSSTSSGRS